LEPRIKERYSESIKNEAMKRYGIGNGQIQLLDGFESYMYEFARDGKEFILRIGHSMRRNVNLIHGEVEWINYLAKGGASVSRAIVSDNDKLVERIGDQRGGHFLATAFVRAAGNPPSGEQWNSDLFERYGRLIGRIHALSKTFRPSKTEWKRPEWDDPEMLEIESWLPPSESSVYGKYHDLYAYLSTLPRTGDAYGLIHQDAHAGNFFVDMSGQITLFDFDDCCYSWYMNDIAIVLFYAAFGEEDPVSFTLSFMEQFIHGYVSENEIDKEWLRLIPYFLKLREIDLYAVIHRSFDVDNIEDGWVASFMKNRKAKILSEIPFIDYDFSELSIFVDKALQ
jgi:Ser/Thr protein kinase RdoA (MazF antagonist)